MSGLILPGETELFRDARIKAVRLNLEKPAPTLKLTAKARAMMDDVLDNLGPIQVLGGKETPKISGARQQEVLDVWFNPTALFRHHAEMTPGDFAAVVKVLSSVVVEYTPGPEVTAALAHGTQDSRIMSINELCERYRQEIVRFGGPEPADLARKRMGVPR